MALSFKERNHACEKPVTFHKLMLECRQHMRGKQHEQRVDHASFAVAHEAIRNNRPCATAGDDLKTSCAGASALNANQSSINNNGLARDEVSIL
jgi:hypothetical protein